MNPYELSGEWYNNLRAIDALKKLQVVTPVLRTYDQPVPFYAEHNGIPILVMRIRLWDDSGFPLYNSTFSVSRLSVQGCYRLNNWDDDAGAYGRTWYIDGASILVNTIPTSTSTPSRFSLYTIHDPYALELYRAPLVGEACTIGGGNQTANFYTAWVWYNGNHYVCRAHWRGSFGA